MEITKIQYKLVFADGREKVLELHVRADSLNPVGWIPARPPQWAALENHQCSNCPLSPEQHAYCPAALNLARLVDECNGIDLLDTVRLIVKTAGRAVVVSATTQKALGSMIGLVMAISDCPHAARFRPMARFHLPLASEDETVYRAITMYAMIQFLQHQKGEMSDGNLEPLFDVYSNLETVNNALSARLKMAGLDGAVAKCLGDWDVFAGMFPMRAEEVMRKVRPMFASWLDQP